MFGTIRIVCSRFSVARAVEDATEEDLVHKPVMSPVQDNDPDGQLREVKEYDNPSYVRKVEETQFNNDTGLSDQELEEDIHHKLVMSPVQDNDPDGQLKEVKEYDNPSYVRKMEETQVNNDTGLSDQELEEDIHHKPVMSPVQDNDPDGQLREVKEYDNPSYMKKTEETQFSYDTELSDQELEDAIRLEVLRNRLGRQVNVTNPDISMYKLRSEGWRRWNTDMDTEYQYEIFNGLPVYYGGDMYDSDDSEEFWLDTPEEMDNKIRNQSSPDGGDDKSVYRCDSQT